MKCAEFVGLFFLARDVTHSVHLNTRSYAKHKALQEFVEFLENQLEEIEKCRYEVCEKTDTPLQNLIDGIVELYLSTLYKLRFLS